jgi:hypothetical protein
MLGRAGRPQFESEGFVVLLTEVNRVGKYEMLLNCEYQGGKIKSNFLTQIEDNLNNEINLKTVRT